MRERALILIVDDNEDNLELASQILEDDYDIITAESGEACLQTATEKLPDLILLDVQMPGIDGYETLARLLTIDEVKFIPVIFLSARFRDIDRVIRGLESGALDYLTKPIDDDLLLSKVRVGVRVKRAEDEVRNQTRSLRNSNKTLESFAYSASHDLRAPLRHICSYCEALLEDYAPDLPDDAQFMLTRISRSATHMGVLIQDLLNFSRASRVELERRPIDISLMMSEVVAELREQDSEHQVQIHIEPKLNVLSADPTLMRIVLTNLLSNAWKYSYHVEHPNIEFSSMMKDGKYVFYLRDNGVGFDMKFVDKLFKPFSRLHSEDEFEGTGIGLATVERIITNHAGRIWGEAVLDQGACFYFILDTQGA